MPFTKINSNFLSLKCLEWKEAHFREYEKCTKQLSEIARKSGTTSDVFQKSVQYFERLAIQKNTEELAEAITKPIHSRAVTHLLLFSEFFRKKILISQHLLSALEKPLGRLTNLTLLALVRLWFDYFDKLGPSEVLSMFGSFLAERIGIKANSKKCSAEIINLHKCSDFIFNHDGPSRLVKSIIQPYTLNDIFSKPGLQGYESGRFQSICRMLYYIETLKTIPVGTDHSVLAEVIKQEVYDSPFDENQLIGHQVLRILIDRSPDEKISDFWQNAILTIAGDPRVPKASPRYQKWWAYMSTGQLAKMYGWLSKEDLSLFLQALEDYSHTAGNLGLRRMFPARKKFLQGLISQGFVKHSRLFLSEQAIRFVDKMNKEQISFARVTNSQISIIYLQVNDCIIIEGTHSFKMLIYSRKPEDLTILNYAKEAFSSNEIKNCVFDSRYKNSFHSYNYTGIHHVSANFSWQKKAINFLRSNGVNINIEEMFSPDDYRTYKSLHGI